MNIKVKDYVQVDGKWERVNYVYDNSNVAVDNADCYGEDEIQAVLPYGEKVLVSDDGDYRSAVFYGMVDDKFLVKTSMDCKDEYWTYSSCKPIEELSKKIEKIDSTFIISIREKLNELIDVVNELAEKL